MARFSMDMSGLREFADSVRAAAQDSFKDHLRIMMQAVGMEFLRIVQKEIRECRAVVQGLLIGSFGKGGTDNIWDESDGGLTIEVGSGVKYARWVNDGHWQNHRWVPGGWSGKQFIYNRNAKSGMALMDRWVSGHHFFEAAMRHSEPILQKMMEKALDEWIARFF